MFSESYLKNMLSSWAKTLDVYIPPTEQNMWGDLCQQAISDAQMLDINSIQFIREFVAMKGSIISLYQLLQGNITPKNLGKLYLGLTYGYRLSLKDSKELGEAIGRSISDFAKPKYTACRAMDMRYSSVSAGPFAGISIAQGFWYKVYYEPIDRGFSNLCRTLMNWDLFPTTQNLWDLIPFSFVMDWFVKMEEFFKRTDAHLYSYTLRVLGTIVTTKSTLRSIPVTLLQNSWLPGWELTGYVDYTLYQRGLDNRLDLPRFRIDIPTEFHNFAELTAIILAKGK
jgi:hypothetical protein